MTLEDQTKALENIKANYENLTHDYRNAKQEHNYRRRQGQYDYRNAKQEHNYRRRQGQCVIILWCVSIYQ